MKKARFFNYILLLSLFFLSIETWSQENAKEEKSEYVIIDSSSNDAVILDQPDFFDSKPLCRLKQNQQVTVTDSTDGEYVLIIADCKGETVKGWVKKLILAKEAFKIVPNASESAGARSNPIAAKGSIGYEPIDTSGFKNQEIPTPWNDIALTSYEAKIITADLPTFNHRVFWPVAGAALIGTTVLLLINNAGDNDVQTPLLLNPDLATSNCKETITVNVLANDQGDDLELQSAQSTNAEVEIMDNDLIVYEISGSSCIVNYTVIDAYGNMASSILTISVNYSPINAQNDDYSMEINSTINGNLLTNDTGQELHVVAFTQPSSGLLSLEENGDFIYQGQNDFSGVLQFSYDIQDACDQVSNATVSITINEIPCDFDVIFETTNASCGFDDGTIISNITPAGNYTFQWSNGLVEKDILNAFAGEYILSVTDTTLNCSLDFSVTVDENPPSYISDLVLSPIICPNAGSIQFLLSSPDGGPLDIHVESVAGTTDFTAPNGEVILGDYMPIEEGSYTILVSPSNNPGSCSDSITVEVESQVILIIDINDIISPSNISANDGAIFGTILSPILPPFELFVNGNPILIDDVAFALEGLTEGNYSLYVISSDGCQSDTLVVDLVAEPKNEARFSFAVMYSLQKQSHDPELLGNITMDDFSLNMEFSTGEKMYHPIVGLAYYSKEEAGNRATSFLEVNSQFEKSFRFGELDIIARSGPFTQFTYSQGGLGKVNLLNCGLLIQPMIDYKLYESNTPYPKRLSMRFVGRFYFATKGNSSGYFIGLVLH